MKSTKILIVDDSAPLRLLLKCSLASQKYDIFEAHNGTSALSLTAQLEPDLVLLDISMPDMNGITVLEEIRKLNKRVGVLMVSALSTAEWKDAASKAGADGYLCKPCAVHEIQQQVIEILNMANQRKPCLVGAD